MGRCVADDLDRVAEEQLANAAFAEESGDLAHDLIEPGNGAERVECGAIGRVFPGARRDLNERDASWHVLGGKRFAGRGKRELGDTTRRSG